MTMLPSSFFSRAGLLLACAATSPLMPAWAHDDAGHGTGFGSPGRKADVTRTVKVSMNDGMRFVPSQVVVRKGQTLRFIVKNEGRLRHEFVLGTDAGLAAHAEVMKTHPDMEHHDPNMVSLDGGQTGEVIWRFTTDGSVGFACLQPGHLEAGMKGEVDVRNSQQPRPVTSRKSQPSS